VLVRDSFVSDLIGLSRCGGFAALRFCVFVFLCFDGHGPRLCTRRRAMSRVQGDIIGIDLGTTNSCGTTTLRVVVCDCVRWSERRSSGLTTIAVRIVGVCVFVFLHCSSGRHGRWCGPGD
jgi:hypothetical protein